MWTRYMRRLACLSTPRLLCRPRKDFKRLSGLVVAVVVDPSIVIYIHRVSSERSSAYARKGGAALRVLRLPIALLVLAFQS